ncbi:M15 family metallopeptidase [Candidatus Dojkabacteria bacterium]|nr:M15 family metallopeptidase [Candidatus Dojkabacteria bacterium]
MNSLNKLLLSINVIAISLLNFYPLLFSLISQQNNFLVLGAETQINEFIVSTNGYKLKKEGNYLTADIISNQILLPSIDDSFFLSQAYSNSAEFKYVYKLYLNQTTNGIFELNLRSNQNQATQIFLYNNLTASGSQIPDQAEKPKCKTITPDQVLTINLDSNNCISSDIENIIDLATISINNKHYKINQIVVKDLLELLKSSFSQRAILYLNSTYRSSDDQSKLKNNLEISLGQAKAEELIANPGHSEHHLGTAIDFSSPDVGSEQTPTFGDTRAYKWLVDNGWKHGFVLSYPEGMDNITGYTFEPWHWRYIGREHAQILKENPQLSLNEYLKLVENPIKII